MQEPLVNECTVCLYSKAVVSLLICLLPQALRAVHTAQPPKIWLIFSARQHAERAICYRPSVRLSVRLSVCLSVCPSVCHTGGSVKNG